MLDEAISVYIKTEAQLLLFILHDFERCIEASFVAFVGPNVTGTA